MAFSVAPTEEIVLIAQSITGWHAVALALVSLVSMHAFVYAVDFRGETDLASPAEAVSEFLRLTVVGYVLTLLICAFVLWSFGRSDGLALLEILIKTVVLAFPGAIGAAAARLIL